MDTEWAWQRGDLPGSGRPRTRLLLPEPDQPQHPESRSILPEGFQAVPHLQALSGEVGNLRIIAKVPGVRIQPSGWPRVSGQKQTDKWRYYKLWERFLLASRRFLAGLPRFTRSDKRLQWEFQRKQQALEV